MSSLFNLRMQAVFPNGKLTPEFQLALVELRDAASGSGSRTINNTTVQTAAVATYPAQSEQVFLAGYSQPTSGAVLAQY